ncbi:uncharacterized protein LOC132555429 [Ylistrum balloti]|uniref:uncharacterized protein LOC132555429 n=1 Tax=Ylistrum balloti TaxID=509963 RepID=UPI002905CAA8|nr:uncharacterized protein LOC132555429 [Ylistrum balloti]
MKRTQHTLRTNGNIRFHKVASNRRDVLEAFGPDDLAGDIKNLNLSVDSPPVQRSLGLSWNLAGDFFTFNSHLEDKPYTRRGISATVNGLYDPLGFAAPVVLKRKLLFRDLISSTVGWDDPLPEDSRRDWE